MKTATKGVIWYLILAFGIAWISWEIPIRMLGVSVTSKLFQLYALPGAFAPAIACFIVRKWITREGFADAGLGLHLKRLPYYLFGWVLPLLVVAAIVGEAMLLGIADPDFALARTAEARAAAHALSAHGDPLLLLVAQVMANALLFTPVLWGEEFGWRSYLQQRLFGGRFLPAAVGTGMIWGVWHWPLTLRGYNFPDQPLVGSLMFPVFCVLVSIIFGWIRERSGSIWASSLAHSATNVVGGSLLALLFSGAASMMVVGYAGLLAIPPLALVCLLVLMARRGASSKPATAPAV